jgi:hypothetical protein
MARGKLGNQLNKADQFRVVDDFKLRLSVMGLADKYDEQVRDLIVKTYEDPKLHSIYHGWRMSGMFQHGGKSKVHREVVRFPNGYIYDFCDTVLTAIYGPDWLSNPKALKHELVRPWHIVNRL